MATQDSLHLTQEARMWLARATGIGADVLDLKRMKGASSASVFRVGSRLGFGGQDNSGQVSGGPVSGGQDGSRAFVLRLFTLKDWLDKEPDLARHEAAALQEANNAGMPTPELVDWLPGPSGQSPEDPVGFGAPAVLMTYLPGRVELMPMHEDAWVSSLARTLSDVHEHRPVNLDWRYKSWVEPSNVNVPAQASDPALWQAGVSTYNRWRYSDSDDSFLHRDFHALNTLFSGCGSAVRITGVVDWVNACVGPAASDVSHCRIDLVKMKGPHAAEHFLRSYTEARGGFDYDPGWDLEAVFDVGSSGFGAHTPWYEFGLPPISNDAIRARVEEFLRRALVDLGVRVG